jgi:flagellar biosynthesis/type III secretory pathway M-ring protein FliF/YscJ
VWVQIIFLINNFLCFTLFFTLFFFLPYQKYKNRLASAKSKKEKEEEEKQRKTAQVKTEKGKEEQEEGEREQEERRQRPIHRHVAVRRKRDCFGEDVCFLTVNLKIHRKLH